MFLEFGIEVFLGGHTEFYGRSHFDIGVIPVRSVSNGLYDGSRGSDESHDLGIIEHGVVSYEPSDGVRFFGTFYEGRVSRAFESFFWRGQV